MIAVLVVWACLAILFAFTDLRISQAIYNPASLWGRLIEGYGEIPGTLVAFACGNILLRLSGAEKRAGRIQDAAGLGLLTFFAGGFALAVAFGAEIHTQLNVPLILGLDLLLILVAQVILRRFPVERLARFKPAAKVGLTLLFIGGLLTVWLIKIPWGRWTYRDILAAGDLTLFTPWTMPQGFNGHFSFISGHAALIFCVLPVALFLKRGSRARDAALLVILAWGIFGALGRVIAGAHFASDILFGACETILWFLLLSRWFKADF